MKKANPLNHPTSIEWPVCYVVVVPHSWDGRQRGFSHSARIKHVDWSRSGAIQAAIDGWAFDASDRYMTAKYRMAPPTDPEERAEVWRKLYLKGYRVKKVRLSPAEGS